MSEAAAKTWKQYQDSVRYQDSLGLTDQFPQFERFKAGEQWPQATARTKNLPRPVFNIVEFFIRSKRANMANQSLLMTYRPAEITGETAETAVQGAKDYTDFAHMLWEDLEQDELNSDFLDDAITLGTGILHYYWDNDVHGGSSMQYKGDLRGEVIDPLNIHFGNPQSRSVQKQPYIIISSRDSVKAVRELARLCGAGPEILEQIKPDGDKEKYDAAQTELDDGQKVTVLTKYYRVKGEVYFSKSTQTADIVPGRPLTPASAIKQHNHADGSEPSEPDIPTGRTEEAFRITLYPIVAMNWRKRKRCMYGIGEAQDLITINKTYNFLKAMMSLSVQQTAWPKILKKPDALRQTITNEPGEILTDYSATGDGIKYMQPANFSQMASQLTREIFEMARTVSGVTDVSTGETIGANMAASAIIALQNQARTPIREMQKRFFRAIKQVGQVWEQFFKTYYNLPRLITVADSATGREQTRMFNGADYQDVGFKLSIDVGSGSEYGEELAMATLDKFYEKGEITLDQYIELAPQNVAPFKEQLKKMREQAAAVPPEMVEALGRNPDIRRTVAEMLQMQQMPQLAAGQTGGIGNGLQQMPPVQPAYPAERGGL